MLSGCTGPDYHGNLNSTDSRDVGNIVGQGGGADRSKRAPTTLG